MITIKNLSKKFHSNNEEIVLFKDLDLHIEEKKIISIIWPSGSWKSTFLNMLSGIDTDYEWDISLDGVNISNLTMEEITQIRWQKISYIFQNFRLIDNLTVAENIDLIIELNKLERNFSTDEILKLVWLFDKKDTYIYHLSWWESQRVAIARAFVWKTKILLADEPTGALDEKNKENIMNLILSLHKKIQNTIIIITHDMQVAKLADICYELKNNTFVNISNV